MTDVLIKRELLERAVKADASNGASSVDLVDGWKAMEQIRAILAAPRQPLSERVPCKEFDELYAQLLDEYPDEMAKAADDVRKMTAPRQPGGEGLEVVAWQDADNPLYTTAERRQMHGWATDGYPVVELCRLSDAQRAIAELREECEHLKACQENAMLHMTGLVAERNTLRQQLAERDAQIASMRAEVTPFIETHWMPVAHQRDKLAGLLRDARELIDNGDFSDGYCMCGSSVTGHSIDDGHAPVDAGEYYAGQVRERIDAALAEVNK